jgi:predicted nucleic acid-binding protein
MLVVADSSPLIVLINIEHIDILPKLFGEVVIPPEVSLELTLSNRPEPVRTFFTSPPLWLVQQSPTNVKPIPMLHPGEVAAINLALEIHADLLLIDEVRGRKAAAALGIRFTGTIGVLEQAGDKGLVDLEDVFGKIKKTDFWISHELLDVRLKLHKERRKTEAREE